MRTLLLALALVLALSVGCGSDGITEPWDMEDMSQYQTQFEVNGVTYNLDDFTPERSLAATPDGTLMTDEELLVYFSAHFTEAILGSLDHEHACAVYTQFHTVLSGISYPPPFTYPRFMVWYMENEGYDVPDVLDIESPC